MDELKPCPFCGGHARMNIVMDSVGVSCRLCGASLIDETREDAIAAWNARAPSVPEGWRDISTAPTTGYFLAWSPDYPELVTCWKAELFHSARKPGTPRHLTANHWTHWRYIDTPLAAAPKVPA